MITHKKSHVKRIILLWTGMLCIGFTTFAQTPYNVVVNLYEDPKTQMAFNWFTGSGITDGKVEVTLGSTIVKTVAATCTSNSDYTENKAKANKDNLFR